MLSMSWTTFRERWPVFLGAVITVCLGVAILQASLLTLVAAATATVPPGLPEGATRDLREGYEGAISLLGMLVGLSAFIAVFIVSSTFAFTVAQRRRDLALLRLTGASRRQVRRLLLGEALLLGAAGSTLGLLLGLPVMGLLRWMLDGFGFLPPGFEAQWRAWTAPVSLGTGVGIAVLGVLAASRRASRIRPLEALRETGSAARTMTASRWIIGSVFLTGGAALLAVIPALGGDAAMPMSMLVLMVLVIAFAALAPLAVPLASWVLGLFARGHLGQLAYANLRAGVRRSASTAAPVMVLVAFVAGMAATLDSLGAASRQELTRTLQADLVLTTERPVAGALAAVDGVGSVSEQVPVWFELRWDEDDDHEGPVTYADVDGLAVDPDAYADTHRLDITAGDLADLTGAAVAVSPSFAPELRWRVGDTLHVRRDGEPTELRIVALLPGTLTGPYFLLPDGFAADPAAGRQYLVRLADGADASAVAGALAELGEVSTVAGWIAESAAAQQRISVKIMVALLGMAAVYTLLAMVNAVVISASDRRVEFATARVTGLTRGQVIRTAVWEALAVVAIGLLLGGLAAAGTVLGVAASIRDILGMTVWSVPWPLLGGLALGAAAVVGVTTVLTTLAATRTPPIRLVAARE